MTQIEPAGPIGFEIIKQVNAKARDAGIEDFTDQFENLAAHAQYRLAYKSAAKYVKPGDRVLDWGCGNGHFSYLLEFLGARVTGFSFSDLPKGMGYSPAYHHVSQSSQDPRSLPFSDASFDAVCNIGVLEHVWETGGDEAASLSELSRVLRRGGIFLTFHLPNRAGWIEPTVAALGLSKYVHRRKFESDEIARLWQGAAFEILEIGLYNFFPRYELRKLPSVIRHTEAFAKLYNLCDDLFASMLGRFCQNYYVIARKGG